MVLAFQLQHLVISIIRGVTALETQNADLHGPSFMKGETGDANRVHGEPGPSSPEHGNVAGVINP
jgi:hypothetical protein